MSTRYTEVFETSEYWRTEVEVEGATSEGAASELAEQYRSADEGRYFEGEAHIFVNRELVDSDTESTGDIEWEPGEEEDA